MADTSSNVISAQPNVTVRVLAATTGVTYKVSLHPSELTVANIRSHLAAAVVPSDQILLLGPPYKVPRDSTLQSNEILYSLRLGDIEDDPISEELVSQREGSEPIEFQSAQLEVELSRQPPKLLHTSTLERSSARRLFLFSKQSLAENAPDSPPCTLEPLNLLIPTEAPGPSPLHLDPSRSNPLHQALVAYERQFMLYLAQGRVLADGADLRYSATRNCVKEQAIMARALRSAVSNLSDNYHGAARTRAEFTAGFQAEIARHSILLDRFESILNSLGNIHLHPSLQIIARTAGRPMSTLLDTVPVERERAWAQQCHTSHQRLVSLFQDLDASFSDLGTTTTRQEEAKHDKLSEEEVEQLWNQVETVAKNACERQSKRLDQLTSDYQRVVRIVTNSINADNEDEVQNAFTPLREISNSSKDLVPSMTLDDDVMKELMITTADAKTRAMKRLKVRLREISLAQSSIQRCLASVAVLKDALMQQTDNLVHLEHVVELPQSYKAFLLELQRRRKYGQAVLSSSGAIMDRLTVMRSDELKAREKFLRGPAKHLMPAFFDTFVPTLATPPPIFTPQIPAMVELDTLPDVADERLTTGSSFDEEMHPQRDPGVGSASTLTAESNQHEDVSCKDVNLGISNNQQINVINDDSESPNTNTAIVPVTNDEVRTLLYENANLRQEIGRLGGTCPSPYLPNYRDGEKGVDDEITKLREELALAKNEALAAMEALESYKLTASQSDKISHSSLEIGDVCLFMPKGLNKRQFVAFHTRNYPHRYLSMDCVKGTPSFIVGRIIFQEEFVAGEVGSESNPYNIHVGISYWVLTVDVIFPLEK